MFSKHVHASKIREVFTKTNIDTITVHWDGKLLPSMTNKEQVDRIAIIVTYDGCEKLIGIPKLSSGSGKNQALSVFQVLEEWNLIDQVQVLCCDTTASNTGRLNGACILLEQELNRNLHAMQASC